MSWTYRAGWLACAAVLSFGCDQDGRTQGDHAIPDALEPWDGGSDARDARDGGSDALAALGDVGVGHLPGLMALNLRCLDQTDTHFETVVARMNAIAHQAIDDDVVAILLEEVCDDGLVDALELLSTQLSSIGGETWHADREFAHIAWEGTPREAREGVAIVSRTTHRDVRAVEYPSQGPLRRVGLLATLGAPLDGLRVMVVHLSHANADVRVRQAKHSAVAVLATFGSHGGLVAGDLNASATSDVTSAFESLGFANAGAGLPPSRIDHILVHHASDFSAIDTRLVFDTPETRVSDHPGIVARIEARSRPPASWTRIIAHMDPALDRPLSIRGNSSPLDWEEGWPMFPIEPGLWVFATSELRARFEYKLLLDDAEWMTGENALGEPGTENHISPSTLSQKF